jgi:ectoine hydroxylase-related dioxygenase (phytanoyl-CoA dioxygenase family)
MALSDAEKRHYRENGFILVPSVFSAAEIAGVIAVIDGLLAVAAVRSGSGTQVFDCEADSVDGVQGVRRLFNPFEQHEGFRRIAIDDRILGRVESLLGPDIALQHSKLNMKGARLGSAVHWHQDLPYFPHTNDDLVGVLIHLDDATAENGCLQVLPGQHRRYFDHALPDGSFAGLITEPMEVHGTPVAVECRAGSVLFLHPLAPHFSVANGSNKQRRLLIFEYRAADAFAIFNGNQIVGSEACAHHLHGMPARFARFGGPPPAIYRPRGSPRSLFELQEEARALLKVV